MFCLDPANHDLLRISRRPLHDEVLEIDCTCRTPPRRPCAPCGLAGPKTPPEASGRPDPYHPLRPAAGESTASARPVPGLHRIAEVATDDNTPPWHFLRSPKKGGPLADAIPFRRLRTRPMTQAYDAQNIFARILRGRSRTKTVLETAHTLAFHDIHPQAPVPCARDPEGGLRRLRRFRGERVGRRDRGLPPHRRQGLRDAGVARRAGRATAPSPNAGGHGAQEVPHYHLHILGGRPLGPMLSYG